jgi:hypothetical protein
MNLEQAIKQKVNGKKYPKLFRNKLGKVLMVIVALPLGTLWLFPVASAMMIPMKPSLWVKDKMRELKIEWQLH